MTRALLGLVGICVVMASSVAHAWDPFLVENEHVAEGNERMAAGDAPGALSRYDQAARQLPSDPRVHLNRGLALLEAGEHGQARDALELATQPPATREVRADAHYDIGLSYYREGDAAATEEDHEEAQRLFREAADAFRASLRARPGNADAGWNLELALRRMQEQQEQQEQEEQEQEEQEQEEQEQEEQENQDQENQDQENQDQENQDQENQDQENQDQENQDQENQDQEDQSSDDSEEQQEQEEDPSGDESSDEPEDSQEPEQEQDSPEEQDPRDPSEESPPNEGTQERSMPPEHRRVLDALQDGEQNFERERARARAARENRRVERDW